MLDALRLACGRSGQKLQLRELRSDERQRREDDHHHERFEGADTTPEQLAIDAEMRRLVLACLRVVPQDQQDVLIRTYGLYGQSMETREEIAPSFGVSGPCISQYKRKGLESLRKHLRQVLQDEP